MKRTLFYLFFLAFLFLSGKAQEDKDIYERYCAAMKEEAALPTGDLMVETARFFLETPYVAGHWRMFPKDWWSTCVVWIA